MTRATPAESIDRAWQDGLEVLKPTPAELEKGLALHRELSVCENYGFLPKVFTPRLQEEIDALGERGIGQVEWKRKSRTYRVAAHTRDAQGCREFFEVLDRSGLGSLIQSVNFIGESLEDVVMIMASYRHLCNVHKDRLFQATCAEDLENAKGSGRTGIFFSLTGLPTAGAGSMADPDGLLDWVDTWYQMGVRFIHLGYNRRNYFADGCTESHDGGLSDFGRDLIARMNKTGIIVDVPHSSPNTTLQAAAASSRPILATHIGCSAVNDHPRCKSDREIKAIAETGGYVGICSVPGFLGPDPDLNLLLRHIGHAVNLVGADHVAVGTDRGYGQDRPASIRDYPGKCRKTVDPAGWSAKSRPSAAPGSPGGAPANPIGRSSLAWTNWPLITVGLVKMGLDEEAIAKILGGNLCRVLRACRPEEEIAALG